MDNKILLEKLDKINNWEPLDIIHCKEPSCIGMLLESIDTYSYKCGDCGKYWDEYTTWKEIK